MWTCELCGKVFDDETTAIEVRFGYVDTQEMAEVGDQYDAFYTESAIAPICEDCAIAYIKGKEIDEPEIQSNSKGIH